MSGSRSVARATASSPLRAQPTTSTSGSRPSTGHRGRYPRQLIVGADDLEVAVHEDVVGPVDADVVDLVITVADGYDPVDDATRVDAQRGFRPLVRGSAA